MTELNQRVDRLNENVERLDDIVCEFMKKVEALPNIAEEVKQLRLQLETLLTPLIEKAAGIGERTIPIKTHIIMLLAALGILEHQALGQGLQKMIDFFLK